MILEMFTVSTLASKISRDSSFYKVETPHFYRMAKGNQSILKKIRLSLTCTLWRGKQKIPLNVKPCISDQSAYITMDELRSSLCTTWDPFYL